MVTPCFERMWEYFWFKTLLKFKASMPLLANFIFRNGRFFVSVLSLSLTALKNRFEEMSKIMPWSRCSGDAASAKSKVKVDSYKSGSMFKGRKHSLVRIWWRPACICKLTNSIYQPKKSTFDCVHFWQSLEGPQALCNRRCWWRFCVVRWFSNFLLVYVFLL